MIHISGKLEAIKRSVKDRVKGKAEDIKEKGKSKAEALKEKLRDKAKDKSAQIKEGAKGEIKRMISESSFEGSSSGKKVKEIAANVAIRGQDTANALGKPPDLSLSPSGSTNPKVSVDLSMKGTRSSSRQTRDFSVSKSDMNLMGKKSDGNKFFKSKNMDLF